MKNNVEEREYDNVRQSGSDIHGWWRDTTIDHRHPLLQTPVVSTLNLGTVTQTNTQPQQSNINIFIYISFVVINYYTYCTPFLSDGKYLV